MTFETIKMITLMLGIVIATCPAAGIAQEKHRAGAAFDAIDANSDGQITADEIAEHHLARFAQADANGDGLISKQEITSARQSGSTQRMAGRVDRMFEMRDANNDGLLSSEEIKPDGGLFARRFDRMDTDNNGGISEVEFAEGFANRRDRKPPQN